ncbi:MAG: glycosyltransferase family 4 protein [Methyloversatilis sp.]|nr:glycosyltransferase family 4 protein [Methyloversatilis sp.]
MRIKVNIPWKVRKAILTIENVRHFLLSKIATKRKKETTTISFHCESHAITGASIAIAAIANLLSKHWSVEFIASAQSTYNQLLAPKIRRSHNISETAKILIIDGQTPLEKIEKFRKSGKFVIISSHGILQKNIKLKKANAASLVHFVSTAQFQNIEAPPKNHFVIPNFCQRIRKTKSTSNVGIVGRVHDPKKNVPAALSAAINSCAKEIHIWGDTAKITNSSRVVQHGWSYNKEEIYNSFDVLVSMSEEESFGLTVIEALSAGIPCVLSSIPAYQTFAECPGVRIVRSCDSAAITEAINELLTNKEDTREESIQYWITRYSEPAVEDKWIEKISAILA